MSRHCWSATPVTVRTTDIAGRPVWAAVAALLVVTGLACGRGDGAVGDSAAITVPGAGTMPTAGAPADTAAPQGATWNLEMVEGQLQKAGFAVSRDRTPVNLPYMSVPGTALDLGGSVNIQVYLYGDAAARGSDTDKLDPTRPAPPRPNAAWPRPATLLTDNNMAAIVLTADPVVRARVAEALHRRADGDGALR